MTAAANEKDALLTLLGKWCVKAKGYRDAHHNASVRLRRWHFVLGVPAIVLSSVVAMFVFATLQKTLSWGVAMAVGVVSVGAAILAACQTFLRCSDRAEAHRQASAEYEGLAERAELVWAMYATAPFEEERLKKLRDACSEVQTAMASLATKRPEFAERDRAQPASGVVAPVVGGVAPVAPPKAPVSSADELRSQSSSSSVQPPAGPRSSISIPPPARLPMATLPPARAPQPHPPAARTSSAPPPPVERWERRAVFTPGPTMPGEAEGASEDASETMPHSQAPGAVSEGSARKAKARGR
jgi:hypothetical protein